MSYPSIKLFNFFVIIKKLRPNAYTKDLSYVFFFLHFKPYFFFATFFFATGFAAAFGFVTFFGIIIC